MPSGHRHGPRRGSELNISNRNTRLSPSIPAIRDVQPTPLSPAWSCSRWGLPCRRCHQRPRCALTAPFHPCLCGKTPRHRRSVLCGTVPILTDGGSYPPPCPVEPGLSSTRPVQRTAPAAIARPTPAPHRIVRPLASRVESAHTSIANRCHWQLPTNHFATPRLPARTPGNRAGLTSSPFAATRSAFAGLLLFGNIQMCRSHRFLRLTQRSQILRSLCPAESMIPGPLPR